MKKIYVFFSAALLLLFSSCSKEQSSEDFVPLDDIVCTRTITVNAATKAGNVEPVELTLTALYSIEKECVTSFEMTSMVPGLDMDRLKDEIAAKFEEINGFALVNGCPPEVPLTKGATKDCFMECQQIPKGEGRGWCKAGCIVDAVIEVVKEVLSIFDGQ